MKITDIDLKAISELITGRISYNFENKSFKRFEEVLDNWFMTPSIVELYVPIHRIVEFFRKDYNYTGTIYRGINNFVDGVFDSSRPYDYFSKVVDVAINFAGGLSLLGKTGRVFQIDAIDAFDLDKFKNAYFGVCKNASWMEFINDQSSDAEVLYKFNIKQCIDITDALTTELLAKYNYYQESEIFS